MKKVMKKISKALLICAVLAALTACGQAGPSGDLTQEITAGAGGRGDGGKDAAGNVGEEKESEASDQGNRKEEEGAFNFLYEGVTLTPGEIFDSSALEGYAGVSEVPSCAFDGSDRVYNYELFELTAYIGEDGERVYSIYFIDPNLPTTEGLCLGDSVEDMKALYGEGYEQNGTAYVYTRGDSLLSVVTQNEVVIGIEYRLDR